MILILGIILFFRDPERKIELSDKIILSPADGRITEIALLENHSNFSGPIIRVSIYLSFLNAHINRSPVSGFVKDIQYSPGNFFAAYKEKAFRQNENNLITIDNQGFVILVRQIAGRFARRIVCRCVKGGRLEQGQRIGMIQFGSGVEIYVPDSVDLKVSVGQKVKAGETTIAVLKKEMNAS